MSPLLILTVARDGEGEIAIIRGDVGDIAILDYQGRLMRRRRGRKRVCSDVTEAKKGG